MRSIYCLMLFYNNRAKAMRASSVSLPSIHVQAGDRAVAATYCFAHHALAFGCLHLELGDRGRSAC